MTGRQLPARSIGVALPRAGRSIRLLRRRIGERRAAAPLLALALAWVLAGSAAQAGPSVRVFAIRGVAGILFSRGMNALCDELADVAAVTCTVEDFTEVPVIEAEARAADRAGQRVVLVGHSMGADTAIRVAAETGLPVAMVAAIDPPQFRVRPVPDNVALVLNYYQQIDVLGRGVVSTVPGFRGRVFRIELDEPHIVIDRDPEIHAAIINEIRSLLEPAPPPAIDRVDRGPAPRALPAASERPAVRTGRPPVYSVDAGVAPPRQ